MKINLKITAFLLLFSGIVLSGCKKDDGEDDTAPQEKKFLSTYYLEGSHIFAIGTSTEVGYFTVNNPYNEQMKVSFAGGAPNLKLTAPGGTTLLHNESLDFKVTYVPSPEESVDAKFKVYLNSFGLDDKRDSNEIRVKVTVK